jgi:predicted nucleic acid-binding protein
VTNQTSGGRQPVVLPRTFYLDASALVKRYLVETGSAWVESICADEEGSAIAIAHFGLVETAAAFAAKQRGQFITSSEHESVLADLLRDAKNRYRLVAVGSAIIDSAIQLTRRQKLRGYDAIHLACALALNRPLVENDLPSLTFVAADGDLLAAAEAEGLVVDNPNLHS